MGEIVISKASDSFRSYYNIGDSLGDKDGKINNKAEAQAAAEAFCEIHQEDCQLILDDLSKSGFKQLNIKAVKSEKLVGAYLKGLKDKQLTADERETIMDNIVELCVKTDHGVQKPTFGLTLPKLSAEVEVELLLALGVSMRVRRKKQFKSGRRAFPQSVSVASKRSIYRRRILNLYNRNIKWGFVIPQSIEDRRVTFLFRALTKRLVRAKSSYALAKNGEVLGVKKTKHKGITRKTFRHTGSFSFSSAPGEWPENAYKCWPVLADHFVQRGVRCGESHFNGHFFLYLPQVKTPAVMLIQDKAGNFIGESRPFVIDYKESAEQGIF